MSKLLGQGEQLLFGHVFRYLFSNTHHYFWYPTFRCYNFSEFRPPNKKELGIMWDKSPIAYLEHVKAPTLIALGMKDGRVPPSQGLEYYHALRAKKVPTKLLMYDDCDHAIDLVVSEADFWINTKCWFDQWLQETKVSSVRGDDVM